MVLLLCPKGGINMCTHPNALRLADGWFCPDCKQTFDSKPISKEPEKLTAAETETPATKKTTTRRKSVTR